MPIATLMFDHGRDKEIHKASVALNALTGVDHATVHADTNSITVSYDKDVTSLNQLRKTVQASGIHVTSEWKEPNT